MEYYVGRQRIGKGTYGTVFRAKDVRDGSYVALKKIRLERSEDGIPSTTLREVSLLKALSSHPNIVRLLGVELTETKLYMVFEHMDADLKQYLDTLETPNMRLVKSYMYQLAAALYHCHAHRVLHRDLKPQNLLIDDQGTIKLADFGLARAYSVPQAPYTNQVVTLWYRAPEVLLGYNKYNTGVDMWSLGCILAEMVTLTPLFKGDSEIDQLYKVFGKLGTPTEEMWPGVSRLQHYDIMSSPLLDPVPFPELVPGLTPEGYDLLQGLLQYDSKRRLTAQQVLDHAWFGDLDKYPYHPRTVYTMYPDQFAHLRIPRGRINVQTLHGLERAPQTVHRDAHQPGAAAKRARAAKEGEAEQGPTGAPGAVGHGSGGDEGPGVRVRRVRRVGPGREGARASVVDHVAGIGGVVEGNVGFTTPTPMDGSPGDENHPIELDSSDDA